MAYVGAESLYELHVEIMEAFSGEPQKRWHELTYDEQSEWHKRADDFNDKRKEDDA